MPMLSPRDIFLLSSDAAAVDAYLLIQDLGLKEAANRLGTNPEALTRGFALHPLNPKWDFKTQMTLLRSESYLKNGGAYLAALLNLASARRRSNPDPRTCGLTMIELARHSPEAEAIALFKQAIPLLNSVREDRYLDRTLRYQEMHFALKKIMASYDSEGCSEEFKKFERLTKELSEIETNDAEAERKSRVALEEKWEAERKAKLQRDLEWRKQIENAEKARTSPSSDTRTSHKNSQNHYRSSEKSSTSSTNPSHNEIPTSGSEEASASPVRVLGRTGSGCIFFGDYLFAIIMAAPMRLLQIFMA